MAWLREDIRRADKSDPDIDRSMPGRWYRVLGKLCRTWYSRRERCWLATVYGDGSGSSVVGTFGTPEEAAEGAASMVELREVGRLTKLSDIGKAKRKW